MKYSVKYKLKNQFFWRTVKNVKGDAIANDLPVPMRVIILEDETRIEIPLDGSMFKFSNGRFLSIKKSMEKEANTKIITNSEIE